MAGQAPQKDVHIFEAKALMTHFDAKLSASTDTNSYPRQILALVDRNNEILFRYAKTPQDEVVLKLVTWFSEKGKEVQDVCFDVAGKWLLVLCDDNTLHVIPALAIVDHNQHSSSNYSNEQITSYVIPFVGPHECPNPRTCPNNFYRPPSLELESTLRRIGAEPDAEKLTLDELYSTQRIDKLLSTYPVPSTYSTLDKESEVEEKKEEAPEATTSPCPYPTAVVWWQTSKCKNRAIIGYSDGSIFIVSLTPNCPLVAYTAVSGCSIQKLRICRDAGGETTTLLIHTTKRSQWKLLLEHKKINFTYPGEPSSPETRSTSQESEEGVEATPECNSIDSDWQIVITKTDDVGEVDQPHPSVPSISVTVDEGRQPEDQVPKAAHSAQIAIPKLFFPSTMAKLTSLKNMGAKKIGALKQILCEAKTKNAEAIERPREEAVAFEIIEPPCISPEILTTEAGPLYIVQHVDKVPYLTALHHDVKTLSVHMMDINLRPIHIYDIPEKTENILLTRNLLYVVHEVLEEDEEDPAGSSSSTVEACSVLSRVHAETNMEIDPLYAMGANHLGQLGIGSHMSQSLHPMLVRAFEGKFITKLVAGQYHNAAVADGLLYTWGWGVYGQLGHGSIADEALPRVLYAMGANHLGQLGIGSHMSQSLHPMLVRAFEGKFITKLVAGQYHNAAVADGLLYTWGWGVYGQLGHGSIADEALPRVVEFFRGKKIEQVSLGYAHSLVLCRSEGGCGNILYVFGSNYFGQLGVGHNVDAPKKASSTERSVFTKSLAPIELRLDENIRLIHTKYFCSALRLINQARKRERASQKAEAAKAAEEENAKANEEATTGEGGESSEGNATKSIPIKRQNSAPNMSTGYFASDISPKRATYPQRNRELKSTLLESLNIQDKSEKVVQKDVKDIAEVGLEEWTEHLTPLEVDTCQVDGFINQVSSGLYHFALRVDGTLYTWGKNLEKQLGNEGSRADVAIPTEVETVQNVLNVECGADYTLALCVNGRVMAFGNNNQGQCAKDTEKSSLQPKYVRLKVSKRHIRLPDGNMCVDTPFEVPLPRPKICMDDSEAVMRLKNLPHLHPKFIKRSPVIHRLVANMKSGVTTVDSNLNDFCATETSIDAAFGRLSMWSDVGGHSVENFVGTTPTEASSEEFMYSPSISECGIQVPYAPDATNIDFIHYCLFMYVDAFRMCLVECCDAQKAILLFEHFTKDENLIPIHMEDIKIFVQEIFVRFIVAKWDVKLLEEYFLADLDFYIIQLAYVLFFCNNNTELERNVLSKYKFFFANLKTTECEKVEKSELIFENVSSGFNIMVCQRLIELYDKIEQSH
uniref:E3 ubiquitin-protein ligase herc2 n=2 Tax=Lutzomyia longipalpis TaxID=7200 RepID=A0A1B0GGW7_LUTLO